jgi:hypothetical protein
MAAILLNYDDSTTASTIRVHDGTDSETERHSPWSNNRSVRDSTRIDTGIDVIRIHTESLPQYFPSNESVEGSQCTAKVYRLYPRTGRVRGWTGRNYRK